MMKYAFVRLEGQEEIRLDVQEGDEEEEEL